MPSQTTAETCSSEALLRKSPQTQQYSPRAKLKTCILKTLRGQPVCVYICIYVFTHTYIHAYIHIHVITYIHIYICIYNYIYICSGHMHPTEEGSLLCLNVAYCPRSRFSCAMMMMTRQFDHHYHPKKKKLLSHTLTHYWKTVESYHLPTIE